MSFHYNIQSYDFHTYFKLDDPQQVQYADFFKKSISEEFANELSEKKINLYKTFHSAIGPHPLGYGMFESDTRDPITFLKLLNFYQKNHAQLSVLIHPRSDDGDLIDHTRNALWLGEQQHLELDFL